MYGNGNDICICIAAMVAVYIVWSMTQSGTPKSPFCNSSSCASARKASVTSSKPLVIPPKSTKSLKNSKQKTTDSKDPKESSPSLHNKMLYSGGGIQPALEAVSPFKNIGTDTTGWCRPKTWAEPKPPAMFFLQPPGYVPQPHANENPIL